MAAVVKSKNAPLPNVPAQPRVLVVDDEPNLVELIGDVISRDLGCQIIPASSIAAAKEILATQGVELLVADVNLPDGSGLSLLETLQDQQPAASAIVITGHPSMDGAIDAIRGGAVDFVPKPFTATQLAQRVRHALDRQAALVRQERRIEKLRVAVRRLNEARRMIGRKVDLLCNDLVTAYGELSRQFDGVRNQEGFRKSIEKSADLEQLLCHAMDWLLREIGYANIAVWLATEDGEFQLGAYMKYTVPGEPAVTDAVKKAILPVVTRDGLVRMDAQALAPVLAEHLKPAEAKALKGQDLLAANCTYLGDSLAAVVFFRDSRSPFTPDDEAVLKAVAPIFANALATVVRGADEEDDGGGDDDDDNGGGGGGGHDNDDSDNDAPAAPFLDDAAGESADDSEVRPKPKKPNKGKPKIDPADWWKRGEQPPF